MSAPETIILYEQSLCSTCRAVEQLLDAAHIAYEAVYYEETPLSREKLGELIEKMGVEPRELLREKEQIYKDLGLADKTLSRDEVIDLLIEHPELMQRPIVERGERAVLARPPERVRELI